MKFCSGNLALNIQNSDKNLLISVLRTNPEYEREGLSVLLHFKQAVVVRDLKHHQHHLESAASTNVDQSNCAIYRKKTFSS